MPYNLPATRLLMNRLRQVMAEEGETRSRLDKVVRLIASTMVADVCSIYLRLQDGALLLIATEGLKADAVAATRLTVNEGLVGLVARRAEPMAIQDAPRHASFSYRPETGEDPFHAFLGVPILRGGRVIGVLTVQNRTERAYDDEEIDNLQTIAMVLAEIVDRIDPDALNNGGNEKRERNTASLTGRVFCEGLGYGRAVLHDPVVPAAKFFAADQVTESHRLSDGMAELKASIDRMMALDGAALGEDPRDVMETYRLLAHDPSWAEKLQEGVRSGLSAEASVDRARREHRARLQNARDPYLRERLHDLEDLDNRLLRILGGEEGKPQISEERSVLVARRLGPAELLEYSNTGLRAILMEEAAASSHAAIVARALGIPALGGIPGLTTRIDQGDWVIVDAEEGTLHIRPDDTLYDAYKGRVSLRSERQAAYEALKDLPARTTDGTDVSLMLNAGLDLDMEMMKQAGADGVGLFRTEFQFLVSESLPKLNDQIDLYKRVLDKADGKPVVFRTVDLGGDKVLPALNLQREENPALGWRSIRFALDHKGLFRRQLRALVRAAGDRPLTIMFPMVTVVSEFEEARDLLLAEVEWSAQRTGRRPSRVEVGVMLETPALAYGLPELAGKAEFLSVGTNDLMQFFFAADRMTPHVSDRYDLVSPSALRFLKEVSDSCRTYGIRMSACGEATGSTLSALCFVALGFTALSMSAGSIGPVKQMIRSLNLQAFRPDFLAALNAPEQDFRNQVLALAADHGIELSDG
ncbi:phosphoenolpyruvate--protein phosphotransferase [Hyphomonas sp.]|uniref:phosphoenolpyruvate--protein phosphotransferase n=1 Tax=Hyphomonas sp. TaxID=87 RepID=UPI0030026406|eukprot:TRINITY_DN5636_c0_g1_i1.p1 TRINITY_DN5636_c0_g1~~TRINITY_DN5636_c0_g1_i1.p1  ORF type:complete len:755 (-),score=185.71 TRINITY_DN5636_c0_g1_i1:3029-5293(-)